MARRIREQSEHGLYHVMLRGLNQQQLFYDDEDHRAFLKDLPVSRMSAPLDSMLIP